jgi:anti-sigma regulatory factor (Ser/Thr protein kinase)
VPENGRVEFVHRSWPAEPAQLSVIRRELAGWLAPLALTDDETAGVVLAVDEAAANVVRHAYGPGEHGEVELTMWTESEVHPHSAVHSHSARMPDTLSIEVVDHGSWQEPAPDPSRQSGRGITLMNAVAESVLIHHDRRGSRVLLRHRMV